MRNHLLHNVRVRIGGMHCASCEVLIERKLKKVPGVEHVKVSQASGAAELSCSRVLEIGALQKAIRHDGYAVSWWEDSGTGATVSTPRSTKKDYVEVGAIFLILVAFYFLLRQFDLVPQLPAFTEKMSYGFVFLIGLVAAFSTCLAVTGGLLLAVAAKYNEANPHLTGMQKFKPHIYFNIGRIVSYTVLGGTVGALGSVVALSARASGVLTVLASLVMILLGFQLLRIFPRLGRFQPRMPKFLAHKIHDAAARGTKGGAASLGAATFFLPCGFTQALQLYVLAQGEVVTGALTMLAFSLGTLPALLSLSAVSSFARGVFQRYFLKFSGALVVMLGFFSIDNGLTLAGSPLTLTSPFKANDTAVQAAASDTVAKVVDGTQVVEMSVEGLSYSPHQFTVAQGVPVEWRINAAKAVGCAQVITVPKLGMVKYLSPQETTTITFTPQETGEIPFGCTMGMTTLGSKFAVVPNAGGVVPSPSPTVADGNSSTACNPDLANCVVAQQLNMEVSRERGFYPRSFTVRRGVPVELAIDVQTPLGGCMSVLVMPDYNVALPLNVGASTLRFTPTKSGVTYATCSMGLRMLQFDVTD